MFGIPYEKIIFQSDLKPSEIVTRLKAVTSRFLWYKFPPRDKDFVGSIFSDGFRIYRNIRGRNTYLPWQIGKIHANDKGSEIVVIMTLHPIAIFIMLAMFLYVFRVAFIPDGDVEVKILLCSVVFIFHLLMYLIGFRPEVSLAKKRLQEILAGK